MRTNLPVSQHEYPFPEGETLVSTTDLQGRILYCNAAFIEVSGYIRQELLGQPHNLIRHPDMPEEAFRDMWETIQHGYPWSGLVKNRRKDGSFYWVMANVTPLIDAGGKVTGYMSVRTQPERTAVEGAEKLYARMREEAKAGRSSLCLHRGQVLGTGGLARLAHRLRPGLRGKVALTTGLISVISFFLGEYEAEGLPHMSWGEGLAGIAAAGVLGLIGSSYLRKLIATPIMRLVGFANQIAGGNLTQTISSDRTDEIGHLTKALAQLNVNLMSIVRDARNGVVQMTRDTGVIAEGNQDLSARTEAQASNLEETASSMEEITSTIRQSTDMAQQAAQRADNARSVTDHSAEAVQALSATMAHISDASSKIADIIQVVDSIAFQTNILALNAAVEAARAGEQGRGFAVVASEVRALAQRTSVAAREVRGLIQASADQVSTGSQQTEAARSAMDSARGAIDEVHKFILQLSHGMQEQMLGVNQVNQAVSDMDSLTQKNAALVEEIAASASTLRDKAGEVASSVSVFQLKGGAGTTGTSTPDAVTLRKTMKAQQAASAKTAQSPAARPSHPTQAKLTPSSAKPRPTAAPPRPAPEPALSTGQDDSDWTSF
ncbi:methyl-accepting chemotaxis protein [Ideonella oryzae]|uniref:Methyl-accepting chemotaxis protein n=1 Tax=Ideonella oryzae TaxID=2937441 RepID=A0ABT1BLI2_9BURK|nr:PAS domain-containing methyl-accepting chemotaxis protein [Ideonella oryzae]MCO5976759.1 methyl-accepting chemotaxis protein [Ideonella oryzae]